MKHVCFIHQDLSILLPSALGNKYLWVNEWINEPVSSLWNQTGLLQKKIARSQCQEVENYFLLWKEEALFKGFFIHCFKIQRKTAGKSRLHQSSLNAPIPNSDGNPFIQKYHWCIVNINSTNEYSRINLK